jgi:hypothetical protein
MFRKLLLSAVLTTATLTGFSMTPLAADASPAPDHYYRHERFRVVFRHNGYWSTFGTYDRRWEADRAAEHLRHDGFEVHIEMERW